MTILKNILIDVVSILSLFYNYTCHTKSLRFLYARKGEGVKQEEKAEKMYLIIIV